MNNFYRNYVSSSSSSSSSSTSNISQKSSNNKSINQFTNNKSSGNNKSVLGPWLFGSFLSGIRYGVGEYLSQQHEINKSTKNEYVSQNQQKNLNISRITYWSCYGFLYAAGPSFFLSNILYPRLPFFSISPLATSLLANQQ